MNMHSPDRGRTAQQDHERGGQSEWKLKAIPIWHGYKHEHAPCVFEFPHSVAPRFDRSQVQECRWIRQPEQAVAQNGTLIVDNLVLSATPQPYITIEIRLLEGGVGSNFTNHPLQVGKDGASRQHWDDDLFRDSRVTLNDGRYQVRVTLTRLPNGRIKVMLWRRDDIKEAEEVSSIAITARNEFGEDTYRWRHAGQCE